MYTHEIRPVNHRFSKNVIRTQLVIFFAALQQRVAPALQRLYGVQGRLRLPPPSFRAGFPPARSRVAAGTPDLYTWLHNNNDVRFLPVDVVNSPEIIAQNRNMVAINGAMAVDLSGQVIADSIGGKQFSGIGGHEDFVAGPGLSVGGRSLVCMPSTTVVKGETVSRILGRLPEGSVVTTPRHQVDVVITEFGAAELSGLSIAERSHELARISHPDFRDQLLSTADVWPAD